MSTITYDEVVTMAARVEALAEDLGPFAFVMDDGEGGNLYFIRRDRRGTRDVLDGDGRLVAVVL